MLDFTKRLRKVLGILVQSEGRRLNSHTIEPDHIILAILKDSDSMAMKIFSNLRVNFNFLKKSIEDSIRGDGGNLSAGNLPLSVNFNRIIEMSKDEARIIKSAYIGTEHLLLALFKDGHSKGTELLLKSGVTYESIRKELESIMTKRLPESMGGPKRTEKTKPGLIEEFTYDLTAMSKDGELDPVIGREKEIERVIRILCRKTKNNPVLIGEAGVGKTAIVEGLAQKIVDNEIPDILKDKMVLSLDMAGIVAGTKYRGEFEDRLKKIMKEIRVSNNIVLFIDELHTIMGAGAAEGAIDAANILKPFLARGEIQCIGATTLTEYKHHIEKDAALERRFQTVVVDEPSVDEATTILFGLKERYEKHHRVKFTDEAIISSVKLAERYIHDRFLPDKAIDVMDETGAKVQLENREKPKDIIELEKEIDRLNQQKNMLVNHQEYEKAASVRDVINSRKEILNEKNLHWEKRDEEYEVRVSEADVVSTVAQWTGIPLENLEKSESEKLLSMEDDLHKDIIGQNDAITTISKAIRRSRTGLRSADRPIGSFIFAGPTGVGKTELAKVLAQFMFDDRRSLIRVDMSEFMEKHAVARLIGSPPGYVGYEDGGQLTEKVRRQPYSIILFDEIEKAHQDFFNILLQVLEEGELTDGMGNTVSFRDSIIIMTSNIGNHSFDSVSKVGFDENNSVALLDKERVFDEVKKNFNPEFINRVDEVIYFHHLSKDNIVKIVDIMLNELSERVKEHSNITLSFSKSLKLHIADMGYSNKFGARYLRRTIENEIEDPLSTKLLSGKFSESQKVNVTLKSHKIHFKATSVDPSDSNEIENEKPKAGITK